MQKHHVLITGAAGYLGSRLLQKLYMTGKSPQGQPLQIIAMDVREVPDSDRLKGVIYLTEDIRSTELSTAMSEHQIDTVIHLAAVVTPPKNASRDFMYSVDVEGTQNLLDACLANGVKRVVVTSSGAAYGYHSDNPDWLSEEDAIRGNKEFSYAWHKRLVEDMMARYREEHPELEQVIFRVSTILGASTDNQITALFEKPFVIQVKGSESPFVFIWDEDMAECLYQAIDSPQTGIYNVAGDGCLKPGEIAEILGKPCLNIPAGVLKSLLFVLSKIGLSQYGPEQVGFLRYRPVLSNRKLKEDFRFQPKLSSKETFLYFLNARREAALAS